MIFLILLLAIGDFSDLKEEKIAYTDSFTKYRVCANKVQYLISAGKFAFWDISQCILMEWVIIFTRISFES